MNALTLTVPTTAAVANTALARYPVDRCVMLRRTCIMQARKYRDHGNIAKLAEWLGYAVYWSGRARKRYETPDETQARTNARMLAWNQRREALRALAVRLIAEVVAEAVPPFNGDYSLSNLVNPVQS